MTKYKEIISVSKALINFYNIGSRLKKFRERLGFTQDFLSIETDIPINRISRIETGRILPNYHELLVLSIKLRVCTDTILGLSEKPQRVHAKQEVVHRKLEKSFREKNATSVDKSKDGFYDSEYYRRTRED